MVTELFITTFDSDTLSNKIIVCPGIAALMAACKVAKDNPVCMFWYKPDNTENVAWQVVVEGAQELV